MLRSPPSEDQILAAWDELKAAIQVVECALPFQMTAAIERLGTQKRAMEDLLLRRSPPPIPPTEREG